MIIVAWNGSGDPTVIFNGDVFKKVLSVFITAAILKLGQGRHSQFYLPTCLISIMIMILLLTLSLWDHALSFMHLVDCVNL